jgi:ankyrin repeat protein
VPRGSREPPGLRRRGAGIEPLTGSPRVARSAAILAAALVLAGATAACGKDEPAAREPSLDQRLLEAAYRNDVAGARRLIAEGADVNAKDASEQSAYLIATSEVGDHPRLLELTLEAGADVDAKDSYNGTGLIRAAERGYPRIVRRLLGTDIDVDHVNRLGWTALLEAIILGEGGRAHTATVRLLVEAGADVSLPDKEGMTPLAHARQRRFAAIERILRRARP